MGNNARESAYRLDLCNRISTILPDCIIIKLPADQYQGIPDLLILFENKWAMLEVKMSENSVHEPNQDWYVEHCNEMSYASFIWPDIEDAILAELVEKLGST